MKTSLLYGVLTAILGLAIAPFTDQTQTSTTSSSTHIQASKVVGTKVKTSQTEEIGEIKDVVFDNNGCVGGTVLSTGTTARRVTGTAKTVAVPWSVYTVSPDSRVYTVNVEKEKIYNAPVFDYARIREYSTSGWVNNVYSYYGVSAGTAVGVGVGVAGQTTTATGATTTTGATSTTSTGAVTNATASPAATATVSPGA